MKKVTIQDGEGQIVEKKSRFIGEIKRATSPEEALELVEAVRKKYFDAKHVCFAYVCGMDGRLERYCDDGEPQGTAGQPLLNLLKSGDITDSVLIVTRYFGGVLLGPGGLVRAYTSAGEAAIRNARLAEIATGTEVRLSFPFKDESTVRRLCRNLTDNGASIEIKDVEYQNECNMNILCRNEDYEAFIKNVTDTLSGCVSVEKKDEAVILYKEITNGKN